MGYSRNYPATSREVTRDDYPFAEGVVDALERFKAKKTWLSDSDRFPALQELVRDLAAAQGIAAPTLAKGCIDGSFSGNSYYHPTSHKIVLCGRLSIITTLHEFGHACGMDERDAVGWSVSLFKLVYPKQYDKLAHEGHCLVRR